MSDTPNIESPQTALEEILEKMERKAKKDPKSVNAFDVIEALKAVRQEYNDGLDAMYEEIKSVSAGGLGDIEIVEKAQKVVGELILAFTGVLKGAGMVDDTGPTEKCPAELRTIYEAQMKSASEFLNDAQAFLEDAGADDEDEDEDEDEEDEEDPPLDAGVPAVKT